MNKKYRYVLKRIALFALVLLSVAAGVLVALRLAFFLMPFLIAFALSSLMEPVIRFLSRKLRISRKVSAPVLLLLLLASIVALLVLAVMRLIEEARALVVSVPGFLSDIYNMISRLISENPAIISWIPAEITNDLGSVVSEISRMVTGFGSTILKGAFVTAISFPEVLIFSIITILATYFMATDRKKISSAIVRHLPGSWIERMLAIKRDLFTALFGYLRAALIMMCITFTELFLGLNIIGARYALLLAFLVAVVDALPILGAGGVLVPWGAYSLLAGNVRLGISILVLYLVVLVVRHIIEPKVVGQQIGMYPLLTLLAMYVGLRLAGFAGLILGPITFLMIRNILITIYKRKTLKEIIGLESDGAGAGGAGGKGAGGADNNTGDGGSGAGSAGGAGGVINDGGVTGGKT